MRQQLTTILVLGGTGNFGRRICQRLIGEPDIRLIVTSRNEQSASNFAEDLKDLSPKAFVYGVALDHYAESLKENLAVLKPDIVIHTAGPFQYQDYRVAEACLACKSHYIDLADARCFVEGFSEQLGAQALKQDVLLVSGASTLPGLSSAVVNQLTDGWSIVRDIEVSIAPARQTSRGISTISAVLSYCGKPFNVLSSGRWKKRFGWQNMKIQKYSELGTRLSAVCDVPDLSLFPQHYPELGSVAFYAALESKLEHLVLWLLAFFTRIGVVPNWSKHAKLFQGLSRVSQRLGSDVGGMRVEVRGCNGKGESQQCCWNLIARSNHGPEIPVSPALVLARKLANSRMSLRGAYPCYGLITLEEFDDEVSNLDIFWNTQTEATSQ